MQGIDENEWRAVQSLFEELIDLPPEEQARRLTKSKHPAAIVEQAAALLTAARAEGILDGAGPSLETGETAPSTYASLSHGAQVGGFTIDRLIGRGGMGEVYLARRTAADFEQQVALKLLRAEAADRGDAFMRERRLLARLEHPGIARLIDAGIAPDGRPYMAMEYIDGLPIDQFCREQNASLNQRLALFCAVCDAVSYAHGNLIIHRDIKPSNIIIDRDGKARLLDFGIAKLLDETALVPATTQAMLTPDYAAPEQLAGEEPTVAADVYALGLILYELLVGHGPWRREGASVPAIIRRVLYEDPPVPSRAAGADAPVPASAIAGDLDAIILKAMRRAPAERYRNAADLAADVERHQKLLPVTARDGSTRYMVGRFVRRYRWAVAASVAALSALLIGAGGIAWQAQKTAVERDVALAEARRSEAINRMLTVMVRDTAASPAGENATVKQMLDTTSTQLVNSLDTSAESATLIATLADLYFNIEDVVGADTLLRKALERGIGKGDPVATAQLKLRLASSSAAMGKVDEMPPLLDYAEGVFGKDPARYRYEMVELHSARSQMLRRQGDLAGAIALLDETLPDAEIVFVENHRDLLTLYNNLLIYMLEANQLDAMTPIFARANAAIARSGQETSMQALAIQQLVAVRFLKMKQPAEAEKAMVSIIARRRPLYGSSAGLAADLLQLGRAKFAQGQYAAAEGVLTEAFGMAKTHMGAATPPAIVVGLELMEAQAEAGHPALARATLAEVGPLVAATPSPGLLHGMMARSMAIVYLKEGNARAAKAGVDKAEAIFTALGPSAASYLSGIPALRTRLAKGA